MPAEPRGSHLLVPRVQLEHWSGLARDARAATPDDPATAYGLLTQLVVHLRAALGEPRSRPATLAGALVEASRQALWQADYDAEARTVEYIASWEGLW
jgi:hypothetical protein